MCVCEECSVALVLRCSDKNRSSVASVLFAMNTVDVGAHYSLRVVLEPSMISKFDTNLQTPSAVAPDLKGIGTP